MKQFIQFLMMLAFVFTIEGCHDKNDDSKPELIAKNFTADAKVYESWTYFSFEKGDVVELTDYKDDLSWDIAFHRADVRLNGGASGKGQGGVIKSSKTSLGEVTEAPETGYTTDQMGQVITEFKIPPVYDEQSLNTVISGWLHVDTSNPPPVYTLQEWVYIVKTASGNFVKLQFTDYTNDKGET